MKRLSRLSLLALIVVQPACAGDPPQQGQGACGDGEVGADEACDDGNPLSGDGCSAACALERCGDGNAAAGELCLATPVAYEGGGQLGALVDLHGDGVLDVLTHGPVSVRRGHGDGALAPTADPLSLSLAGVVSGDFDGDGLVDVAGCDMGLSVYYGVADFPHFDPANPVQASGTCGVQLAVDLDGDGLDDLVTSSAFGDGASVLRAGPGRTFSLSAELPTGGLTALAATDLDADGLVDVVGLSRGGVIHVMLGMPGGTLAAPVDSPLDDAEATLAMALGDVDGDGIDDVAATDGNDVLHVLTADATGVLSPLSRYGTESIPSAVAIADMDHDGIADVLVATAGHLELHRGLGGGALGEREWLIDDDRLDDVDLALADLDDDSLPDVVVSRGLFDPGLFVLLARP